ncbi:MAG: sterol desaturase family protein [Acidobacteria bacterium]|nr:sterol desaturase family protein [Acidobacteriota bacterium]
MAYVDAPTFWSRAGELYNQVHQWLFEALVQPVLFGLGWMSYDELAYEWTHLFLVGVLETLLLVLLIRPLEWRRPVEAWANRGEARVDILYTLLARLGILPILFFFLLTPVVDWGQAQLRMRDVIPPNLEDYVSGPAALVVYLIVIDFADYWRHRLQHKFSVWWALHSLHHSQRQMTFWTDDREHLLDQIIAAAFRAAIGLAIGVPPASFLTLSIFSAAVESFSHANARVHFGAFGERILVSPRYHRMHHAMHEGHTGPHQGCNFATLFPVWDVLFGTADFRDAYLPTGVEDQTTGRDYGAGFWSQQWLAVRRMFSASA